MPSERILVVDDSHEVRDFLANTLLGVEGYEVATATDGLEGMEAAVATRPDLIITDHAMPKMTGLEMLAGLRAQGLDMPAILITAEGSEEIAAQAFRVGVRYYFIKPFDPTELQAAIQSIFPESASADESMLDWGGQEAHRTLAALDDAVLVASDSKLRYANPAAALFLKKRHPDALFGKKLAAAIKDRGLVRLLTGDAPAEAVEFPTGDGRTFLARVRVIEDVGRVVILEDITAQRAIDEKRSDFVATVAHDLRSPLTGIMSYLELMSRVGALTPEQAKFTTEMRRAVGRMTNLLNDLLELSRIESGRETPQEPVSLKEIVDQVIADAREQLNSKRQTLIIEGQDDKLLVKGNPRRLLQVFANLIENAVKYTPEGGAITVRFERLQGQAMASVSDTGIGIAHKDIPHVFDKFYRVEEVASEYEGTGLGLSIVKSVVEAHNGRVWVESANGQGSTFTVVLPALVG